MLGLSSATDGPAIRDRVGYMPEQEAFLAGMSAVELCAYAAELSGLPRTEAMQRAHAALYYAGLEDKRYQPIDGYSTGMKQRVKLAQALVHDPELLFLDEPTNGLDPRSRDEMLELITELPARRGCAIVLSTHLLPDVERVCDHAVIMRGGQVRFVGTIDELRGVRGDERELAVEVKADADKLAAALVAAGATCKVVSPIKLDVDLPANGDDRAAVRARARTRGVQIRGIEVRARERRGRVLARDRRGQGAVSQRDPRPRLQALRRHAAGDVDALARDRAAPARGRVEGRGGGGSSSIGARADPDGRRGGVHLRVDQHGRRRAQPAASAGHVLGVGAADDVRAYC